MKKITIDFFAHKIKFVEPNKAGDRLLYIKLKVDPISILTAIDDENGLTAETLKQVLSKERLLHMLKEILKDESEN